MKTGVTTVSFVESLIWWQEAMVASVAGPTPTALFSLVDLAEAAVDVTVAREWVEFLERVAKANAEIIAEIEGSVELDSVVVVLANRRNLLSSVRRAHEYALEHVAQLKAAARE